MFGFNAFASTAFNSLLKAITPPPTPVQWGKTGGIGWKQAGRIAIHFRFQTDASSAIGYHVGLPNTDHASGFEYGRH